MSNVSVLAFTKETAPTTAGDPRMAKYGEFLETNTGLFDPKDLIALMRGKFFLVDGLLDIAAKNNLQRVWDAMEKAVRGLTREWVRNPVDINNPVSVSQFVTFMSVYLSMNPTEADFDLQAESFDDEDQPKPFDLEDLKVTTVHVLQREVERQQAEIHQVWLLQQNTWLLAYRCIAQWCQTWINDLRKYQESVFLSQASTESYEYKSYTHLGVVKDRLGKLSSWDRPMKDESKQSSISVAPSGSPYMWANGLVDESFGLIEGKSWDTLDKHERMRLPNREAVDDSLLPSPSGIDQMVIAVSRAEYALLSIPILGYNGMNGHPQVHSYDDLVDFYHELLRGEGSQKYPLNSARDFAKKVTELLRINIFSQD